MIRANNVEDIRRLTTPLSDQEMQLYYAQLCRRNIHSEAHQHLFLDTISGVLMMLAKDVPHGDAWLDVTGDPEYTKMYYDRMYFDLEDSES